MPATVGAQTSLTRLNRSTGASVVQAGVEQSFAERGSILDPVKSMPLFVDDDELGPAGQVNTLVNR